MIHNFLRLCGTRHMHLVCMQVPRFWSMWAAFLWTFNHVWIMYQYGVWSREPSFESLVNTYIFFIYSILIHTAWGPEIEPQRLRYIFHHFYFFLLRLSWDWVVVVSISHILISFIIFFLDFSELTLRLWNRITIASLYFSIEFP